LLSNERATSRFRLFALFTTRWRVAPGLRYSARSSRPVFLEEETQALLEAVFPDLNPPVAENLRDPLLGGDERDFNTATIAAAKEVNVGIFVDRQTEKEWQDAIDKGAVGIQTNFPAELTAYLRAHGCHQ
jgi:hypothetical protein